MNDTILFIDDDTTISPLIMNYKLMDTFPGYNIRGTGSLKDTVEYAKTSKDFTLYVLDSNMYMDLNEETREELIRLLYKFSNDPERLMQNSKFSGLLVAPLIKQYDENCKIILLTAYYQLIKNLRKENHGASDIVDRIIDDLISKSQIDPNTIEHRIKKLLI